MLTSYLTLRTPRLRLIELTILPAAHWRRSRHARQRAATVVCVAPSNLRIFLPTTTPPSVFRRAHISCPLTALMPAVVMETPSATLAPTGPCRSLAREPRPRSFGRPEPDQPSTAIA